MIEIGLMVLGALCLQPDGFQVPQGATATLDGAIDAAEWAGASRTERDGHTLLLMHDGERMFVGLQSPVTATITTIFIRDGDRVRVLHASAALGEAVYQRQGDEWLVETTPQQWARFGDNVDAQQHAFYDEHGWTGSHARMGSDGDTELAVSLDALRDDTGAPLPVAIVLYEPAHEPEDCRVLFALPATLDDDATSRGMNAGFWPDAVVLRTDDWATLVLRDDASD